MTCKDQDEHAGLVTLAVVGGIVCAALLGWGLVHPILVLNHTARLAARADRAIESIVALKEGTETSPTWSRRWDGSVYEDWAWFTGPPVGEMHDVTVGVGAFPWFDKAAYGAGVMPDGDSWDLKAVVEALSGGADAGK
jgi:hypothetical protein